MDLPFSDEVNYWKTSRTAADAWVGKSISLLRKLGATDIAEAFGSRNGNAAFILAFAIDGESFRIAWPVLPNRKPGEEAAARVQAATLLYHDCKAKALSAAILGPRTAFIGALLLPGGHTVAEASLPAIAEHVRAVALLN